MSGSTISLQETTSSIRAHGMPLKMSTFDSFSLTLSHRCVQATSPFFIPRPLYLQIPYYTSLPCALLFTEGRWLRSTCPATLRKSNRSICTLLAECTESVP